ncbi:hypothetical protein Mag101_07465 [Microbulbifer agarilyticus]|uniref:Uncharacterized protein n=1 Tax=Microbulbifer agarilyticus TaxID=260552 RepID=A0A1Q2M4B1_9GAMM|nr:hypothetical protein Mag101_07465 [Microbulbifer agarilyticus]
MAKHQPRSASPISQRLPSVSGSGGQPGHGSSLFASSGASQNASAIASGTGHTWGAHGNSSHTGKPHRKPRTRQLSPGRVASGPSCHHSSSCGCIGLAYSQAPSGSPHPGRSPRLNSSANPSSGHKSVTPHSQPAANP